MLTLGSSRQISSVLRRHENMSLCTSYRVIPPIMSKSQEPTLQQTECPLTNGLSLRGSNLKSWTQQPNPYDERQYTYLLFDFECALAQRRDLYTYIIQPCYIDSHNGRFPISGSEQILIHHKINPRTISKRRFLSIHMFTSNTILVNVCHVGPRTEEIIGTLTQNKGCTG